MGRGSYEVVPSTHNNEAHTHLEGLNFVHLMGVVRLMIDLSGLGLSDFRHCSS